MECTQSYTNQSINDDQIEKNEEMHLWIESLFMDISDTQITLTTEPL